MRLFLTGATGFIGSTIVSEFVQAGHQVVGLSRSESSDNTLRKAGVEPCRGDLEDLDTLRRGADSCEAVVHTGFNHDFSKFLQSCEWDRKVIDTLGSTLAGSNRPLVVTSVIGAVQPEEGQLAREDDKVKSSKIFPRAATEEAASSVADAGGRVITIRLAQIHDEKKQGLVSELINIARRKRSSAYIGHGLNRWSATHVTDAARLYRLALERNEKSAKYHAVAEEGPTLRQFAEVIGKHLHVPVMSLSQEEAADHFSWFNKFTAATMTASSEQTRQALSWKPIGRTILADLEVMDYSAQS